MSEYRQPNYHAAAGKVFDPHEGAEIPATETAPKDEREAVFHPGRNYDDREIDEMLEPFLDNPVDCMEKIHESTVHQTGLLYMEVEHFPRRHNVYYVKLSPTPMNLTETIRNGKFKKLIVRFRS